MPKCIGITVNGKPCRVNVPNDGEFCRFHFNQSIIGTSKIDDVSTGYVLELLNHSWTNIKNNEDSRNKLFNIFLIICGVHLAVMGFTLNPQNKASSYLPLFSGVFVEAIVLFFIPMMMRIRKVLVREVRVIKEGLGCIKDNKHLLPIIDVYLDYYLKSNNISFYKHVSNTNIIMSMMIFISSFIVITGINMSICVSAYELAAYFLIILVFQAAYTLIMSNILNPGEMLS